MYSKSFPKERNHIQGPKAINNFYEFIPLQRLRHILKISAYCRLKSYTDNPSYRHTYSSVIKNWHLKSTNVMYFTTVQLQVTVHCTLYTNSSKFWRGANSIKEAINNPCVEGQPSQHAFFFSLLGLKYFHSQAGILSLLKRTM